MTSRSARAAAAGVIALTLTTACNPFDTDDDAPEAGPPASTSSPPTSNPSTSQTSSGASPSEATPSASSTTPKARPSVPALTAPAPGTWPRDALTPAGIEDVMAFVRSGWSQLRSQSSLRVDSHLSMPDEWAENVVEGRPDKSNAHWRLLNSVRGEIDRYYVGGRQYDRYDVTAAKRMNEQEERPLETGKAYRPGLYYEMENSPGSPWTAYLDPKSGTSGPNESMLRSPSAKVTHGWLPGRTPTIRVQSQAGDDKEVIAVLEARKPHRLLYFSERYPESLTVRRYSRFGAVPTFPIPRPLEAITAPSPGS